MTCFKCNTEIEPGVKTIMYRNETYHSWCFDSLFEAFDSILHTGEFDPSHYVPAKDTRQNVSLKTTEIELLCSSIESDLVGNPKLRNIFQHLQLRLSETNEFAKCKRKGCSYSLKLMRISDMVEGKISTEAITALAPFLPGYSASKKKSKARKIMLFCSTECDELFSKNAKAAKISMEAMIKESFNYVAPAPAIEVEKEKEEKEEPQYEVCCECNMHHAIYQCADCGKWLGRGHCGNEHGERHMEEEQIEIAEEETQHEKVAQELATDYAIMEEHLQTLSMKELKQAYMSAKANGNGFHIFEGKKIPNEDWKDLIQDVITIIKERKQQ